jgi:hypothetical protein
MGIEVGGIAAPHAENAPALALRAGPARCFERPGRERGAGDEAGSEKVATGHPPRVRRIEAPHGSPLCRPSQWPATESVGVRQVLRSFRDGYSDGRASSSEKLEAAGRRD